MPTTSPARYPLGGLGAGLRNPAVWLLIAGDAIVFLLFSALGHNQHKEATGVVEVVAVALPFAVGWFLVAPWIGAFTLPTRAPRFLARTAVAWLCVWPVGLLLRALVQHRDVPPAFAIVALLFNALFLLIWRTAFALYLRRIIPRG